MGDTDRGGDGGHGSGRSEIDSQIDDIGKAEPAFPQFQELEALGTLAGGLAHSLNNILQAIVGYGSLLQMGIRHDPMRTYVDQILTSSQKTTIIVQSLLAFSGKQPINPKLRTVNEVVTEAESTLKALLGEDVEFNIISADPDVIIDVDIRQMDQVLVNLAVNARDAMPQGGKFTVCARLVEILSIVVDEHFPGVSHFPFVMPPAPSRPEVLRQ